MAFSALEQDVVAALVEWQQLGKPLLRALCAKHGARAVLPVLDQLQTHALARLGAFLVRQHTGRLKGWFSEGGRFGRGGA